MGKMAVPAEKRSSGAVGWAKMVALTEMEKYQEEEDPSQRREAVSTGLRHEPEYLRQDRADLATFLTIIFGGVGGQYGNNANIA